ncbi:MAG TPA: hypothetical protein IAC37_13730 [Candidatus Ventrimonas merdavium]|nr:hypothetical protein [Candidatus Ventrimonas merdavium]
MNLTLIKSFLPDFNIDQFCMFEKIISLDWKPVFDEESWEDHKNLILEMISPDHYKIMIECRGVDTFRFQGDGHISGFYIKDMSASGYEKYANYKVGDYEEHKIEFYCSDIIIKNLEKIEDSI